MGQPNSNNATARHLTVKYLLTLGLLGGIASANYLILRNQIAASRSMGEVVNLSGHQQTLLQHSVLLARDFASTADSAERAKLRDELSAMADSMRRTHHGLIRKDSTVPPPESVQLVYFSSPWLLDTEVRNFVAQLRSLIEAPDRELGPGNPHVRYLLETGASGRLVDGLEAVVSAYQQEAEATTDRLHGLAFWSLGSTVAVLAISGWLVFRPMVHRVRKDMDAIGQLNATLEQRVAERTALAEERARALAASERAMRDQTRILQSILDSMSDGVVVVEKAGPVRLFNPRAREIFHLHQAEDVPNIREVDWTARYGLELYLPDGRTPCLPEQSPLSLAAQGEAVERAEIVLRSLAEGRNSWLSITARPLADGSGAIGGGVAVVRDITSRVEAERKLLQSERLAAIGQMVAGVAHESRNALQQIQACCGLLRWQLDGNEESLELLRDVDRAKQRLQRLFDDLRGYAAPPKLEPSHRDLREIVGAAWESLAQPRDGRNATLRQTTLVADTCCTVDPMQLEQVFRNILENSLAACVDPVEIDVGFSAAGEDGQEAVRVSIRDNGPGLNPEQRERIFQPFYTTKSRGSGLGMAITKRIVEAHGGQIEVVATDTPGTEILITLPRGTR
ncbi:MAG: PAS domain-containing protein [Pirellulaceae bacterium]|nr:PAS domain-containing protein [Pirellulaceae bacterium]